MIPARCVVLVLPLAIAACALEPPRADVREIEEAERAFARLADEIGVRPAFVANFADDAVWMIPAPTTLAAAHAARPGPADPRAVRLEWGPAIAGIAASGDLGYSTGPSRFSLRDGSRPAAHGIYFSIWKRLPDGRWRVALDTGVQQSAPVAEEAFGPPVVVRPARSGAGRPPPLERERSGAWDAETLRRALASDARLIASDAPIATGVEAVAHAWGAGVVTLAPAGGAIARSGDLAYTYGRYAAASGDGYYVHLWTRDGDGAWRIAMIVRP